MEGQGKVSYYRLNSTRTLQTSAFVFLKHCSNVAGVLIILYSMLPIATCVFALLFDKKSINGWTSYPIVNYGAVISAIILYAITIMLTLRMMTGVFKEQAYLIKPWVMWQMLEVLCYFVMIFDSQNTYPNKFIIFLFFFIRLLMMVPVIGCYIQLVDEENVTEQLMKTNSENLYSVLSTNPTN